jgi:hypothetical protein
MKTKVFVIATLCATTLSCSQPEPNNNPEEVYEKVADEETQLSPEEQEAFEEALKARTEVLKKLKEKAAIDFPDDYITQEYWYNEQVAAYDYMVTLPDDEIKRKAQRDFPLDFITQKYWYHQEMDAKERMK